MKKSIIALVSLIFISVSVEAGKPRLFFWKKKSKVAATDTVAKKSDYEKLFSKKHQVAKGMITLHQIDGKVYFEMPLSLFDKDMLIGSTITNVSDNKNGVVGSKPTPPLHIKFTKNKTHVQLREVNTDYIATERAVDQALKKSMVDVILENKKIAAYNKDSSAVVFDMTSFFLSDNKRMSPFDQNSAYSSSYKRTESYKSDRSFLVGVKAFDDNVSIKSSLSYTFTLTNAAGQAVLKDQPFTAEMTRSIMLLKEKPYRPRIADYRIGYFFTQREQLGDASATSMPVYFTNRWDLQPKDSAAYRRGEIVDVVKPVIFYIDNTFPSKWKPYIMESVNQWSKVFEEECHLRNAVVAKEFPTDNPEFDPDNIKYNCIRYAPVNIRNAMGPSWVDPRSGEILMASVYVYHDFIKLISNWLLVQTAQADPDVRTINIPEPIMGDAIRYVIGHEVGHCLGLMHNMGASHNFPVEKLRDPAFTQKYGTTPSIMDYARFNYVAQPGDKERGVRLTPPQFGVYDRYAIKWGYTPVFDMDEKQEQAYMEKWISDSLRVSPWYRYGKQQFNMPFTDPRSMNEDLGDDAVKATKYGVKNLKYIMAHLDEWLSGEEVTEEHRKDLLQSIVQQYALYTQHVASNVFGYCRNEAKDGDGQERIIPLKKEKQVEAYKYLFEMYEDLDWMDNRALLDKIPLSGSPKGTLRGYMNSNLFALPILIGQYNNVDKKSLQPKEALDMLYDFVWKPTIQGKKLSEWQCKLQKAYLNNFLNNSGFSTKAFSSSTAITSQSIDMMEKTFVCTQLEGTESYNPVAGFEPQPRQQFNLSSTVSQADLYVYLQRAQRLIKSRISSSSGDTKAHYELLDKVLSNVIK
ncbi:MAG: zinc-dependent metalloprotease [Prevotella sp.]|nr:zinc-dependent metalloprotease [Prevotella sp.]MBQ9223371.1 zinc-dependent metalloprotease [Prevotella sp.]